MKITIAWTPETSRLQVLSELPGIETIAILELAKLSFVRQVMSGKELPAGVPTSLGPLPVRRVDRGA